MTDLLALTAQLVDMASVSHEEGPFVDWLDAELRAVPWLTVERVGANLVARTALGRSVRMVLAGHTDTVPVNGNAQARVEGDTLWGLGSADMKSGLAVMLELARTVDEPAVDVTYVFYAGEEVAAVHNGLGHLFRDRPDLVAGDVALLGEPTGAAIEAGCQGTLRIEITLVGVRAHTARPWMGRNAIHRLGELLAYRRGVRAAPTGHRRLHVPRGDAGGAGRGRSRRQRRARSRHGDRSTTGSRPIEAADEAAEAVRTLLAPVLGSRRHVRAGRSGGRRRAVARPSRAGGAHRAQRPRVRAKLGWTDVARFAGHGVPAANFGPGDSIVAHTADERVERAQVEACFTALDESAANRGMSGGAPGSRPRRREAGAAAGRPDETPWWVPSDQSFVQQPMLSRRDFPKGWRPTMMLNNRELLDPYDGVEAAAAIRQARAARVAQRAG